MVAPQTLGRRVLHLVWPTFWFFFRAVAVLLTLGFDVGFWLELLRRGTPSPSDRFAVRGTTIFILMHLVVLGVILATFKDDLRRLFNSWTCLPPPIAEGQTAVSWSRAFWRGFRTRTGRFLGLFERWVVLPSTVAVLLLYIYFLIKDPPSWKMLAEAYFLPVLLFLAPFLVLAAQVRHLLQTRAPGQRLPRPAFWAVGCGVWMLLYAAFGWPFNKGPVAAIRLTGPESIRDLAFSHDGKRLAAVGFQEGEENRARARLVIWDLESQQAIVDHQFDFEGVKAVGGTAKVSFHPNNRVLAVSFDSLEFPKPSYNPYILVWDIPGGTEIRRIPGTQALFSPDGAHLAVVSRGYRTVIRMFENSTLSASRNDSTISVPWLIDGPVFSPNGDHLAVIILEKVLDVGKKERFVQMLAIWDVATGVETTRIRVKDADKIPRFAWSPDGTRLALGTEDGAVRIWDWRTHQELKKIAFGSTPSDHAFVFLPDGKRLAVIGAGYELVAYDIERDRAVPLRTRAFSKDPLSSYSPHLTVSSSGKLAANDGTTVYVWDLQ